MVRVIPNGNYPSAGFAEEAMTALEVQTQANEKLRQQLAAATRNTHGSSAEAALVTPVS